MRILIKYFFSFLIMFFLGLTSLMMGLKLSFDSQFEKVLIILLGCMLIILSIYLISKVLLKYLLDPQNYKKILENREREVNSKGFLGFYNKSIRREKKIFNYIIENPLILLLYLASFLLVCSLLVLDFIFVPFFLLDSIVNFFNLTHLFDQSYIFVSVFVFFGFTLYSFIALTILFIPYFILAEMFQRKIKGKVSENMLISILKDYFFSIPYLLILSFSFVIFAMFSRKNANDSFFLDLVQTSFLYLTLSAISYWVYYSIAKIAYDEKRSFFPERNPIKFYKENFKEISSIWISSGYYFAFPVIFCFIIAGIVFLFQSFSFISLYLAEELYIFIGVYLGIPSFIILLFGILLSSQLSTLNFYIKKSESFSEDFVLNYKK